MLKKIQILMAVLAVTCLAGCGTGTGESSANIFAAVKARETESQETKDEIESAETERAE